MMAPTFEAVRADYRALRHAAIAHVQRHAAIYAPAVSAADVAAVCAALGDISIEEAVGALDRWQQQGVPT